MPYEKSNWINGKDVFTKAIKGKLLRFSISYPEDKPDLIYISIWRLASPKDGKGNPFPIKNKNGGWTMIGGISLDELPGIYRGLEDIRKQAECLQKQTKENPPESESESNPFGNNDEQNKNEGEGDIPF